MMDQMTASRIVLRVVERLNLQSRDPDLTLNMIGLISPGALTAFREMILLEVLDAGYSIPGEMLRIEGDSTLRDIRDALQTYSLPGNPTTGDSDV